MGLFIEQLYNNVNIKGEEKKRLGKPNNQMQCVILYWILEKKVINFYYWDNSEYYKTHHILGNYEIIINILMLNFLGMMMI